MQCIIHDSYIPLGTLARMVGIHLSFLRGLIAPQVLLLLLLLLLLKKNKHFLYTPFFAQICVVMRVCNNTEMIAVMI